MAFGAFGWASPTVMSDNSFPSAHGTRPVGSGIPSNETAMRRMILPLLVFAASACLGGRGSVGSVSPAEAKLAAMDLTMK